MSRRVIRFCGSLALCALSASANAETASVKDTTLLSARANLSHYDLKPNGTAAQLADLGRYAREHAGQSAGEEARFLQAAVASDLWFIADVTQDAQLKAAIAGSLGVPEAAVLEQVAHALKDSAHGVYKQVAELAIVALSGSSSAVDHIPRDTRSDALLLRAAAEALSGAAPLERLAQLAPDPCAARSCAPSYAELDARGRRALSYLEQVSAADQRLRTAAHQGDPLAEALAPTLDELRHGLQTAHVQLTPQLGADTVASAPERDGALPQLDAVFSMRGMEVHHAQLPSLQWSEQGLSRSAGDAVLPHSQPLVSLRDAVPYARPIDELVGRARTLRNNAAQWSVGMAVAPGTPTLLWARALVSLVKAGATQLFVIARTAQGATVSVPVHLVQTGYAEPVPNTELKLRVRLGGYTVKLPGVNQDIPRFQDETGYHFDQDALRRSLASRKLHSAAVSYMGDVAVEQLVWSLFCVPPLGQPIELIIQ